MLSLIRLDRDQGSQQTVLAPPFMRISGPDSESGRDHDTLASYSHLASSLSLTPSHSPEK